MMSTAVRVTAMTLLYVILLVRCEVEHAFELVVASVRIPDLRSRTGASGIGRRSSTAQERRKKAHVSKRNRLDSSK